MVELQKKYAQGRIIDTALQTNGTLLNDEWCRFFKDNNWLVGVSIDGPLEFHDEYRKTQAGAPSFRKVMQGIDLLRKHGVEWNALAVVNDFNGDYPLEFYHFFKEIECIYIQFTPIVERIIPRKDGRYLASPMDGRDAPLAGFSVSPEQWGDFIAPFLMNGCAMMWGDISFRFLMPLWPTGSENSPEYAVWQKLADMQE